MKNLLITFGLMAGICPLSLAQGSLDSELRLNGKKTLEVFSAQKETIQNSSAVIYRGYKRVAYGVVMSKNGYILTKASELEDQPATTSEKAKRPAVKEVLPLSIRIGEDKVYKDIKVVKIDVTWDLALLKVDAEDLSPVDFIDSSELSQGTIVISNGATSRSERRVKVGVISANPREIQGPAPVVIGVMLDEKKAGLFIQSTTKDGAADEAGLLAGDQILRADMKTISNRDELIEVLMSKQPGDELKVVYVRKGEEVKCSLKLMARPTASRSRRMSRNDFMSGRFSRRRDSFPRVMQVDIPIDDKSCGGPLINLSGECLGLMIARANRAETFVIPAKELQKVYAGILSQEAQTDGNKSE